MEIYAHRCNGFGHPENSIRAIRAALLSDVHAIEIDLRLTKDLKWVAIHNPFVSERREVRRVHMHAYSRLRKDVNALDEVLALFAAFGNGKTLFLDVKDVGEERQLVKALERHGVAHDTVVIAWEPEVLRRVHRIAPTLRLGLSYVPLPSRLSRVKVAVHRPLSRHGVLLRFNELHTFDPALSIGTTHQHYLSEVPDIPLHSIQVYALFCSAQLVKDAHARGLKVIAFTVNNRITAALLRKRKVDGFLTNVAPFFLEQQEKRSRGDRLPDA